MINSYLLQGGGANFLQGGPGPPGPPAGYAPGSLYCLVCESYMFTTVHSEIDFVKYVCLANARAST